MTTTEIYKEAAERLYRATSNEDIEFIIGNRDAKVEYCRWIRNRLQLWHTHALTENWRTKPETRVIINGIDFSADHPDAVSVKLTDLMIERYFSGKQD